MSALVTVYHTPYCPYCIRARRLLDSLEVPYEGIDVSGDPERRAWLREATGQGTVPQIFVGERSIGGSDELHALHRAGRFLPLLEETRASSKSEEGG